MRFLIYPLVLILSVLSGPFAAALAEPEAPFGLTWGVSVEQVQASGVRLQLRLPDNSGVRFAAANLPKALSDLGEAILSFGNNNKLHKIEAISEDVVNDPEGLRLKARYAALSRALTSKYGQGVIHHEIVEPWTLPDDFLTGIYRGSSHYYTDFTGENVTVRLEIRASRRGISNYAVTFQHMKAPRGNGLQREKDVL
ncbi:MAG: hypothetical protein O3C34_20420 [Proteobacteria bacterium]|nr:hypothetical protein [Pseudomonadota bacterium]